MQIFTACKLFDTRVIPTECEMSYSVNRVISINGDEFVNYSFCFVAIIHRIIYV